MEQIQYKNGGQLKSSQDINTVQQWYAALSDAISSAICRVQGETAHLDDAVKAVADIFKSAREKSATVFWVGNGGSAAICSHLSQDMMNKLDIKSQFFGDTSLVTCMSNDFGYEAVYARPIEKTADSQDVLIAISSSGNSGNILSAVDTAQKKGMKVISLSGMKSSNPLWNRAVDAAFFVESDLYGIVEVGHEALLHGIIETQWIGYKAYSQS